MRVRVIKWLVPVLLVLLLAGAWLVWRSENHAAPKPAAPNHFSYTAARPVLPGQLPAAHSSVPARVKAALATNTLALRLSNTPKSIRELVNDPHAILLENALIDTRRPLDFSIPKNLQASGDPGAYIVQARGPITAAFRAALAQAGAQIVSYIPNDAYLVRVSASGAGGLAASPFAQSVIPYEPYYKIQSTLLNAAIDSRPLPEGAVLNLGLFADAASQTMQQIGAQPGVQIVAQDRSPFGPILRVQLSTMSDWTALAALPGVQIVEPFHPRVHANDLSRVSTGVATDTLVTSNYMNLTGKNVLVAVNDSGIDATHPDLSGRVFGSPLIDTNGHGTHVAGIIAGDGSKSLGPPNVGAVLAGMNFGSVSNADFRGMAPAANLLSLSLANSDEFLQEAAAQTNALISNNSWNNDGDNAYDLDAASYDAATRDALPETTGSQPVLFVFSAGNAGNGNDTFDPGGGDADSIQSPGTAKNVITVGALQEMRSITNSVTNVDGTIGQPWLPETSTSFRIAGFSSRGNVGIGIEGGAGRFKPDVVAPGTFIVSDRSQQWDTYAFFYLNPTNIDTQFFPGVIVSPKNWFVNGFPFVPNNAISVNVTVSPNANSPSPFPDLPIYYSLIGAPAFGFVNPTGNQLNIPPDGGYTIDNILNTETFYGFNYAISNKSSEPVSFDLSTTIVTTNGLGNENLVLSNLDDTIGPYYRFETGTSMSAADVSGVLALMEDYFTNRLSMTPSPALLKAMLINGARPTDSYNLQVSNVINYVGWGQVNLPNSLPPTVQSNSFSSATVPSSIFIQDQSPTNALATGDSHAWLVQVQDTAATLHVTLAWTDPPGNPAAAIKLVNNLILVVSNIDTGYTYFGNNIPAGGIYNIASSPTNDAAVDTINNVQNVILPNPLGTNYVVSVLGRAVNVNAISAQTNNFTGAYGPNIVQDYALVVTSGDGAAPGSFTITDNGIVSNPTAGQNITFVGTTNQPLLNQMVGANSPVVNADNVVGVAPGSGYGATAQDTVGMTNQWHFYVVANNGTTIDFTNAGFVTFVPPTLSLPREGVFAGGQENATRPQADIDLYVTTDPSLTNLNPMVISNCLNGTQVGASAGGVFNGASLTRGGTEFVVDTNSKPGEVYYIGVKSEDQLSAEYDFIPIFSQTPFSTLNPNGDQMVNGLPIPVSIPDGTPANPGMNFVFGLAIYPISVKDITVSNEITHQNFGDLYGTLTHTDSGTGVDTVDVLNNHDAWGSVSNLVFVYNETNVPSGNPHSPPIYGPSDGPGSLQNYFGQDGSGVWRFTELDDSFTQTGGVQSFTMVIQPHLPLTSGSTNVVPPHTIFYDFVDVPAGATNLTIDATNVTAVPDLVNPLLMVVKFGSQPTLTNADKGPVGLTNGSPPGNSISIGPTDIPPIQPGRYWVGITNQSNTAQAVFLLAVILPPHPIAATTDFASSGPQPLLDDAVTFSDILVTNDLPIVSMNVGLVVQHPRISDLVFSLIAPDGTRVLLMENRGGTSTNGAGATIFTTNVVNASSAGGPAASTNVIDTGETSGSIPISYNFFPIPDEMTIYYSTNLTPANLITNFFTSLTGQFSVNFPPPGVPATSTQLTIVMNATNHPASTYWTYTIGSVFSDFIYLAFTEDTNRTTTPIKFAPPPFVPNIIKTNLFADSFEAYPAGVYSIGSTFGGWRVLANAVGITTNPPAFDGTHLLAIQNGAVSNNLPTVAGRRYALTYAIGSSVSEAGSPTTNANWQVASVTFTATQNGTPLVLDASGGGLAANSVVAGISDTNALFDDFTLTELPADLYYLPEQSLTALNGSSSRGLWQLEVQDDRAGAGLTNSLVSWTLQFVFANTNTVPGGLPPGTEICNTTPPGDILWYQINVPLNAVAATNILISATTPVNLLFNQNAPDTNGAITLLANSTGGSIILSITNTTPPLIPGSTYYLGVQNTNADPAFACVEVDFNLLTTAFAFTEPAQLVTGTSAQLNGMATPNGFPATAWFQWGTKTLYGNSTPPISVGSGYNVVYVTNSILNLVTNVPYHFRLVVSNSLGVVFGFDQILDEANVVAWGANFDGQLNVPTNKNVTAISGGYDHNLALTTNGQVLAWGDNTFGQATVPAGLSNTVTLAAAGGQSYSIALQDSGIVTSWGVNLLNQTNVPPGLNNVVAIAGGTSTSLALQNNGTVVAWGANFFGLTNVPVSASNSVAVAGGTYHALAVKNDGTVTAWGDDSIGQTDVPTNLDNVVAIAAGSYHSLALKYDGTVVAWGDDSAGQADVPGGLSNVVAVAAGGFHSLALKNDGTLVAWGDNSAGQQNVPGGLTNFVAISAGFLHSLALTPQSVASLTNVILDLTPGVPQTGTILAGGITYYLVNVPANADIATNALLYAQNGPLNVWFTTNAPPSIAHNATLLLPGATNGVAILNTNSVPANIIPGTAYYLGLQNTNSVAVNYSIEVDFHLVTTTPPSPTNVISGFSIVYTNGGFLLTWFAPSNDLFQVQWTDSLAPVPIIWNTFTNPPAVSYNTNFPASATNAQFNFFDDGSQTGGTLGTLRFYRVVLLQTPPPQTNIITFNSIIHTNIGGSNGFLLTWFAPSNDLFQVQWTGSLPLVSWNTFTNPPAVSYNTNFPANATSALFNFFDDGSQTGGFGLLRFYRIVLLQAANTLTLPAQSNLFVNTNSSVTVTNTATDSRTNVLLSYSLVSPPMGASISTNGVIVWTNASPPGLAARFTTVVMDNGSPAAIASNTFTVFVQPLPSFNNITVTATNVLLQWTAPTNDQFRVQWTTNLATPIVWTFFPGILTSSNGLFSFTDTNPPVLLKLYELVLLP